MKYIYEEHGTYKIVFEIEAATKEDALQEARTLALEDRTICGTMGIDLEKEHSGIY